MALRLSMFLTAAVLLSCTGASAASVKVLYSFCALSDCADGEQPSGELLPDGAGGFFGTTIEGGPNNAGEIFDLVPNGGGWSLNVLYGFCSQTNCSDGEQPQSNLIADQAGDLYGATVFGGNIVGNGGSAGVIFELMPNAGRTSWTLKVLHRFCAGSGCPDGSAPQGLTYAGAASGVAYDGASPLYGATQYGGTYTGGTVFVLKPNGKGAWNEKVLHDFCVPFKCQSDGALPGTPVVDGAGNLFGPTDNDGKYGEGTIYEVSPKGKSWSERTIHDFCPQSGCSDGGFPLAPLIVDGAGDLLGTTTFGGGIFKLAPSGKHYDFTLLHAFCQQVLCTDGLYPQGRLAMDASGNLLGTTVAGGGPPGGQGGTVFSFGPPFKVLYSFCGERDCTDGAKPRAAVTLDASGNIYSTTSLGGAQNEGTIFELAP
ncbi:MAG TPA: choice-of-anchor tandem repeat GloVer-containing protein [Rhizomicrobium sp.]|nr:choice-of-anchor tandem repeat GloVer-containing protein [Rhizomicrobium sp.]